LIKARLDGLIWPETRQRMKGKAAARGPRSIPLIPAKAGAHSAIQLGSPRAAPKQEVRGGGRFIRSMLGDGSNDELLAFLDLKQAQIPDVGADGDHDPRNFG
jgi:hypothetical protein